MAERRASRLPLAWRIFLLSALLLLLCSSTAVAIAWWVGGRVALQNGDEALAKAAEAHSSLVQQRLRLLERTALMLQREPDLLPVVATEGRDAAPGAVLQAWQRELGFDLGLLFDPGLRLLAASPSVLPPEAAFEADPLLLAARDKAQLQSGQWRLGDGLYQAAALPLAHDGAPAGLLLVAQQVDDAFARDIARISEAGMAFWLPGPEGPLRVASSFPAGMADALAAALASRADVVQAIELGQPIDRIDLEFSGQRWRLQLRPTAAEGERGLGVVSALASRGAVLGGYRAVARLAWIAGLAWLLLSLPASVWLSRRILQPTRALATAAEQAAAGNYRHPVELADRNELASLGRAFDSLLLELREKREVEDYVARVSRFLPEAGDAPAEGTDGAVVPEPRRLQGWLLGIEFLPDAIEGEGTPGVEALSEARRRVQQAADGFDARVLAGTGQRFVLAFEGRDLSRRALQAARMLLDAPPLPGLHGAGLAMADGEALFVSASATTASLLGGAVAAQLDRLLSESAPGRVLLARGVADTLKTDFGTTLLSVATGSQGGRRYFALHRAGLEALGWPDPCAAAAPLPLSPVPLAARRPRPGSEVGGRYRILATLGEGRSGVVYKARDLELRDIVALRLLPPGALPGRELARLQDSLRAARRIAHPNVLRVFDFGTVEGVPFISGEYVRGVDLGSLLAESGRVPCAAGLRIARQFCAGLAAAHEVGVLHRDLRPGNLILDIGGQARLMDVGLAPPPRSGSAAARNAAPWYASPEQLAGEELDVRSDIWSAGVVLFEMFCGGLPYPGPGAAEVYRQQMQGEPVRPQDLWSGIPPALQEILLRCIARERDARYRSAAELGADLAQLRA